MKDTEFTAEFDQAETHSQKYLDAVAAMERDAKERERVSYAVMATAAAMGAKEDGTGALGKATVWARTFCILFAMVVPNLLLIRVVF